MFNTGTFLKLQSCYNKCVKLFSVFRRRDSFTQLFLATGLPSFSTVLHNCNHVFNKSVSACTNTIVVHLLGLSVLS